MSFLALLNLSGYIHLVGKLPNSKRVRSMKSSMLKRSDLKCTGNRLHNKCEPRAAKIGEKNTQQV